MANKKHSSAFIFLPITFLFWLNLLVAQDLVVSANDTISGAATYDNVTATPIALSATATVVDFTTDLNQSYGGANGIAALPDGKYGLFSGDFNRNGQVQNTDYAAMVLTIGTAGYASGDFDLNGQVQNTDLHLKLVPNIGKGAAF